MNILVTGAAGFIGFHTALNLLKKKNIIIAGVDNLNNYYDINLKKERLKILKQYDNFKFAKIDITNKVKLLKFIEINKIQIIIHLAAQAGVRYSITSPDTYFSSNLKGFYNVLEVSREKKIKHLIFASTSSVYGDSANFPLKEEFDTSEPESFYAATKKCNEVMAYSYSAIYKINITGLRFFTVYGPYGRPDMALFKFIKAISEGKKIDLYNKGMNFRDFTYVDDIVCALTKLINKKPKQKIPYEVFNIGRGKTIKVNIFIKLIEKILNKKIKTRNLKFQKGDVLKTHASVNKLIKKINYTPNTNIEIGVKKFIEWYINFYKLRL
tara:strand:+ start:2830 stop:3804 length:975 start_codon:yes stop_codon:yes gene_type:complete